MFGDFTWTDAVGILGSLMLVWAYWGVSRGRFNPEALNYQGLHLGGSFLLLLSLYFRPNPGAIVIEVLWAAIAITAILRISRRR